MSPAVPRHPAAHADTPGHPPDAGANTLLGFWIYLMSDCLLFASLFAAYAVLGGNTAGGASGRALFELPYVAVETLCLLLSSVTYGMAMLAMKRSDSSRIITWLGVTF